MKRVRKVTRANHKTIKDASSKNLGDQIIDGRETHTAKGFRRVYTTDLCDFCLEVMCVYRWQLRLRGKRGLKFLCWDCYEAGKAKYSTKIVPCWSKSRLIAKWNNKKKK